MKAWLCFKDSALVDTGSIVVHSKPEKAVLTLAVLDQCVLRSATRTTGDVIKENGWSPMPAIQHGQDMNNKNIVVARDAKSRTARSGAKNNSRPKLKRVCCYCMHREPVSRNQHVNRAFHPC